MSATLAGFGINTSGSPRRLAQRDTEAYWRRLLALGGTDINSNDQVQNVQEFLSGVFDIKQRAVWSLLLLRAPQSAGTGALLPPCLGALTGTLTNGPTWGEEGIAFDAALTQYIPLSATIDPGGVGVAVNTTAADHAIISARGSASWVSGWGIYKNYASINSGAVSKSSLLTSPPLPTGLSFAQATFNVSGETQILANQTMRINKGSAGTSLWQYSDPASPTPPSTEAPWIGSEPGGNRYMTGTVSLVYFCSERLTVPEQDRIYDLYKSTLGQGLGLP